MTPEELLRWLTKRTSDPVLAEFFDRIKTREAVSVAGLYDRRKAPVGARILTQAEPERDNRTCIRPKPLGEGGHATDWNECPAVERTPGKVSGAWVFSGTRIPLYALYENLAAGATVQEFAEWFPGVEERQVIAVLEHEVKTLRAALAR